MKKLLLLSMFFLLVFALMGNVAKAQESDPGVTISVFDYFPGSNNMDTFSYYITSDGWLNYSLVDNTGGGNGDGFESDLVIANDITGELYYYNDQIGGGNIIGSVYIGTDYIPYLVVSHDCGSLSGDNAANAEEWQESVSFD